METSPRTRTHKIQISFLYTAAHTQRSNDQLKISMSIKICKEHKRDKNKEEDTNNNKINPVCEALGMETTEKWHTHTHTHKHT